MQTVPDMRPDRRPPATARLPLHRPSSGRRVVLLPVLLLWILAGCARTRPVADIDAALPEAFPHHTADQIRHHLILTSDTLSSFRARASMVLRSPEQSGSFTADVKSRRADSLYLSISPGLGIEAARALVTPDSFFLYDRIKNRLLVGSVDAAAEMLALPVEGDAAFRNLLGLIVPEAGVVWDVEADSAFYYLRDPTGTRAYTVDPALWRVVGFEERTPAGELVEERTFSEFDVFEDVYLPRRVVFRRPADEATAVLYYRSLDLNLALTFDFRVSSSARRESFGR